MAEYKLTYTADGIVKHELFYREEKFEFSMIPNEYGKTGDEKAFDHQVSKRFPNENKEVIYAVAELGFADEDEIEEVLRILENYENL